MLFAGLLACLVVVTRVYSFFNCQHKVQFFCDLTNVFVENNELIFNCCCGVYDLIFFLSIP